MIRAQQPRRAVAALVAAIALLATLAAAPAGAQAPPLVTEEMRVPAGDPGIELYVRNKRPADMTAFRPERTLLFVHGSSYPASTLFDLAIDGVSWMDHVAARGYDVYLVDVRGYGGSTRPPEMEAPPQANPPIVRTAVAAQDVGAAVDAILKRRNIPRLNLVGFSWGSSITASHTVARPETVQRLVLYAPQWVRTTPTLIQAGSGPLGAYRLVRRDQARDRWLNGVPEDRKATLIPAGVFERWADATWATDPKAAASDPPGLRAPNGTLADTAEFWAAGKPVYDPARITVPTLVVGAEWDRDNPPALRQALFPLLVNAPTKRYVELAEGTHTVMLERNRMELFRAVQAFLDEAGGS